MPTAIEAQGGTRKSKRPVHPRWTWFLKPALLALAGFAIVHLLLGSFAADSLHAEKTRLDIGQVCAGTDCKPAALLSGRIPKEHSEFTKVLAGNPAVKTLCLSSNGGDSEGGASLSSWIDSNGYGTCVPRIQHIQALCASACTIAFAGGTTREVDKDAAFAIHGGYFPPLMAVQPDSVTGAAGQPAGSNSFLRALSIGANETVAFVTRAHTRMITKDTPYMKRLIDEAAAVPGHEIKLVSPRELQAWGVTTTAGSAELVWSKGRATQADP
jgi:hypothetical protein